MATPRKPKVAKAVAAEEPVVVPFVPMPATLPHVDARALIQIGMEQLGYANTVIRVETAPDNHIDLFITGRNRMGATMILTTKFPLVDFHHVLLRVNHTLGKAATYADSQAELPLEDL